MKNHILIVGAGEMGLALSRVLGKNKDNNVSIWDVDPTKRSIGGSLEQMASDTDFLFLCVPSHAIDTCIDKAKKHIRNTTYVISLTKGIERKNGYLTSELLMKNFNKEKIAVLSGPMIAEELKRGLKTKSCLASGREAFNKISMLFVGTNLSLELLDDIPGASASGVLKNIYALGLGIADGLKMGSNTRGILLLQAIREMQKLIPKFKGKTTTVLTLAGLGDLEATSSSEYSRNHLTGSMIARGKKINHHSEGALSLPLVVRRIGKRNIPPFMAAIYKVVQEKKNPRRVFETLFNTP